MKKILIIGGTSFVGRVLCEKLAQLNKYDVTLFNRGKTNPELFPEFKRIIGDRETDDILKIAEQDWDCVIDISSYYPNSLEKMLKAMKGKMKRYIYISTVSVFEVNQFESVLFTEESQTTTCSEEQKVDTTGETYSQRKSESERIILQQDWLDKIIFRPSLIFGKYDPTDRLYYWIYRAKNADHILVPEEGKRQLSYTYVEDLADIMIKSIEIKEHREVYNLDTVRQTSHKEIIETTSKHFSNNPKQVNISFPDFVRSGLKQWTDLPMYIANIDHITENKKVIQDFDVKFKSVQEGLRETYKYYESLGWPLPKAGISLEKEMELIKSSTEE